MKIKNNKDLKMALEQLVNSMEDGLERGSEDAAKVHRDHIDKVLYNAYTPRYYDRTGDLRDSFTVMNLSKRGSGVYSVVGFDVMKMRLSPPSQHMSVITGESFREYLPATIAAGKVGNPFGSTRTDWRQARDINNPEANSKFLMSVDDALYKTVKNKGFNIK